MNDFVIIGLDGPYKGCTDVQLMCDDLDRQRSAPWRAHADRWTQAGAALQQASGQLGDALKNVTVWRRSAGSASWQTFNKEVSDGVTFLLDWKAQADGVAYRLTRVAEVLDGARGVMAQYLTESKQADEALKSDDDLVRSLGRVGKDQAALHASVQMNILSALLQMVFDGLEAEFAKHDWLGPEVAKPQAAGPQADNDGSDKSAAGGGAGTEGGTQPKTDAQNPSEQNPADKKPDDKQPEAKDPVEEAGKVIDTIGKGIDLIGKVPDNLDKWITLAQHAKDLVDPGTATTTPTVTTDPTKSLLDGLPSDQPALAGGPGTTTAPTFHPNTSLPSYGGGADAHLPLGSVGGTGALGNGSLGRVSGTSERTAPVQKSATVAGAAGAEPELSGKTAGAASAATSKQSAPPMYPPQTGGMGAGGNGAREVKPGAGAGRRPGFNVPAEQSEGERLRRHGVQSELQGRSNGETRSASGVPPLRKRKRSVTRPVEREVLDEDLWRL